MATFDQHQPPRIARSPRVFAFALVILLHVLALLWLALERAGVFPPVLPPIEVQLIPGGGGGQPSPATETAATRAALPSSVHRPPEPTPSPDSVVAPLEPAPQVLTPPPAPGLQAEPPLEIAESEASQGAGAQAGQGGGVGTGTGTGSGTSAGAGNSPSRWVRTLTRAERDAHYPRDAARRAVSGTVVLNCVTFASTRIERCRVRSETPRREGFGEAALQAVRLMRRRPPVVDGRTMGAYREDITIYFTPPQTGQDQLTR